MSVKISTGAKKKVHKSIKLAAAAAGIPYMTFYMRIRMGLPVAKAMNKPVRKYVKKEQANVTAS